MLRPRSTEGFLGVRQPGIAVRGVAWAAGLDRATVGVPDPGPGDGSPRAALSEVSASPVKQSVVIGPLGLAGC